MATWQEEYEERRLKTYFLVCVVRTRSGDDFGNSHEGRSEVSIDVADEAEGRILAGILLRNIGEHDPYYAAIRPLRLMRPNEVIEQYQK